MTLKEMKIKVFKLIEEASSDKSKLTDDDDFNSKINDVINQIMLELIRYKKIPMYDTLKVKKGEEINLQEDLDDFFQLNKILGVDYDIEDVFVRFNEEGTAQIYYYKFPREITSDTKDTDYKFELSADLLSIMPYGVAGDILKSDVSNNYGSVYANRYRELLQGLDPRFSNASVEIKGGIEF